MFFRDPGGQWRTLAVHRGYSGRNEQRVPTPGFPPIRMVAAAVEQSARSLWPCSSGSANLASLADFGRQIFIRRIKNNFPVTMFLRKTHLAI